MSKLNFYKLIPYPMDTQDPPTNPTISLLGVYICLDNEKDAMTSHCLDRKEIRCATWQVHNGTGQLVRALCTRIGRLFLSFGGPGCANRISKCSLDRVLTYKNLIYLLNLQIGETNKLLFLGPQWSYKQEDKIKTPFWKDVVLAWANLLEITIETID